MPLTTVYLSEWLGKNAFDWTLHRTRVPQVVDRPLKFPRNTDNWMQEIHQENIVQPAKQKSTAVNSNNDSSNDNNNDHNERTKQQQTPHGQLQ